MYLSNNDFKKVVNNTPLISIDLIVINTDGKCLLGKRNNKPAQGFWFVPGGRVVKNESIVQAFGRLLKEELDLEPTQVSSEPIGTYEHFYSDSAYDDSISTHYVVLAYKVFLKEALHNLPLIQHNDYGWFTKDELLSEPKVHKHSKWYFQPNSQADSFANTL